jgi:hypothetical protein
MDVPSEEWPMNKSLLAALNTNERLLIAETEPANLALLDEDETSVLHTRVLRARNKVQGVYRRGASSKVGTAGGRGKAHGENAHGRLKVEAFEEGLARVSARLAKLARQAARELRDERLAAASVTSGSSLATTSNPPSLKARSAMKKSGGNPRLRTPVSEKNRAGNQGANARWQGKRDGR